MFITLYGINNIGKTYHAKRLVERLNALGKKAKYVKYPIYAEKPTGPLLNKILRSRAKQKISEEELQLLFALNRYQFQPRLQKLLAEGQIVVAEDYVGTGIAWGTAKSRFPKKMQAEFERMNQYLLKEDLAILLDGRRALGSKEARHIHEQNDRLVARCQKIFRKLRKKYGWKNVLVADDKDVTASRVWEKVKKHV